MKYAQDDRKATERQKAADAGGEAAQAAERPQSFSFKSAAGAKQVHTQGSSTRLDPGKALINDLATMITHRRQRAQAACT